MQPLVDNPAPATPSQRYRMAAAIILGGTQPEAFWGVSFELFLEQFSERCARHLMDPKVYFAPRNAAKRAAITGTSIDYSTAFDELDGGFQAAQGISREVAERALTCTSVIGLNGPIGCGKDTLADSLVAGHHFRKMSFADPLRVAVSVLYDLPMNYFVDRQLKDAPLAAFGGRSPRRILQLFGTEVCRDIRDDIWTQRMTLRIASFCQRTPHASIVIADVRFQNESEYIRALPDGSIGFISRQAVGAAHATHAAGHASENGITRLPQDVQLTNDSSLDAFIAAGVESFGLETARPRMRL